MERKNILNTLVLKYLNESQCPQFSSLEISRKYKNGKKNT
jgi:hypothetical protein